MNKITKKPIEQLGTNFIKESGTNEHSIRFFQTKKNNEKFRQLSSSEIEILVLNKNKSDNWTNILVSERFNPELVRNCTFYGLVRIGNLENVFLEYHDLQVPVGLYNSTIVSCDFDDNVAVDNVSYIAHYIVGAESVIRNIDELITTDYAKFGNGILKNGEAEELRIQIELGNENGNRAVLPYEKLNSIDCFLWAKYRADQDLQNKFKELTEKEFTKEHGTYGTIGEKSIVKNCRIIKDVKIGKHAYIKGANKLKNLTVHSNKDASTQIGEGVELVNGIIGYGCRIFYGVKAVRFILRDFSQLKYGARLINSFLGENSTISCCEVLNSLIFPFHEQHHNNSFLIASMIKGQSNMAAGATVGSNHNSRGADGEIVAERGFWPALCSSFKHFSKFSSFCLSAKGQYPYELNITLPFSLISNNDSDNTLQIMPAYWFIYNMYAMARNPSKFKKRDKRINKEVDLEFDYLAPDTINEIFSAMNQLELWTGMSYHPGATKIEAQTEGYKLLNSEGSLKEQITAHGLENSDRPQIVLKTKEGYTAYTQMIKLYSVKTLVAFAEESGKAIQSIIKEFYSTELYSWINAGGQIFRKDKLDKLFSKIKLNEISSWDSVHKYYTDCSDNYSSLKVSHSIAALSKLLKISNAEDFITALPQTIEDVIQINREIAEKTIDSRTKDYNNPFRMITFDSEKERDIVLGKLAENSFISQIKEQTETFEKLLTKYNSSL